MNLDELERLSKAAHIEDGKHCHDGLCIKHQAIHYWPAGSVRLKAPTYESLHAYEDFVGALANEGHHLIRELRELRAFKDTTIAEATKWIERETIPMVFANGELYVPIEEYNRVSHQVYLFAGVVKALSK